MIGIFGNAYNNNSTRYIQYLNEVGVPDHDKEFNGGRVPMHFDSAYGEWLHTNDPIAFEAGLNEWVLENGDKTDGRYTSYHRC